MNSIHKISAVAVYGALAAALGISLYEGKRQNHAHTPAETSKTNNQKVDSIITLENVVVASNEPYFCYADDIKYLAVRELASLADARGDPVFTCEQLFAYNNNDGNVDFARELLSFRDQDGNTLFSGADIFAYKEAGGTIDFARKFLSVKTEEGKNVFYGAQLAQIYRLGLDVVDLLEFKDTPKPNALMTFPTKDNNPDSYSRYTEGTFRGDNTLQFFREMKQVYDVKVLVSLREEEIYAALDASEGFESYTMIGHGSQNDLGLGSVDLGEEHAEVFSLDVSDTEMAEHLQHLSPHAVIFVYSCSTAQGRNTAENLVNKIAEWAPGRKVIGATEVLNTFRVKVDSYYPFEVTLMDFAGEKDITYRVFNVAGVNIVE